MKKVMSLVLSAALASTVFAGCGNNSQNSSSDSENTTNNSSSEDTSSESGKSVFRITGGKTRTLNPHVYESDSEYSTMSNIYGSMLRYIVNEAGDNYEPVPYHAVDFPTSNEESTVWTFELKEGLTFSDGTPITAETYEYSYKMLLDPVLKNYRASMFFRDVEITNAKAYFNSECQWEDVGIKVLEGNKLEITLSRPVPRVNFEMLFAEAGPSSPVHPDLYESCFTEDRTENTYGTSLETTASSGPYVLTEWIRDQSKIYAKNENDPLANIYKVDEIQERVAEDATTALTLFENGDTDYVALSGTNYDKYAEDPRLQLSESAGVWSMFVNSTSETNPILGNKDFRSALFYGADRNLIANEIFKTAKPAPYFVPEFRFTKPGEDYRSSEAAKALVPENGGYDTTSAVDSFNKAYEANGNKQIVVQLKYFDTSDSMKKTAEFLEEQYEGLFGTDKFDLQLQAIPWQSAYEDMKNGDFDLAFGSWIGWIFSPWAGMEVYTSNYQGKYDRMANGEFDKLYESTMKGDLLFKEQERLDALVKMEEIMYEEVAFIPIYQARGASLFSDRVTLHAKKYLPVVGFGTLQAEIAPLE